VDLLDLLFAVALVGAALGGFRLGFLSRIISWSGLALGLYVAIRLLPPVVRDFQTASPGVLVVAATVLLIAGAMAGQAIGLIAGSRLHRALPFRPLRQMDRAVGAVLGGAGVVALLWLLLPSIAAVPGWPARMATDSVVARWVVRDLPAPPNTLEVLRRIIGNGAPQVFAELEPAVPAGPPPASSPLGRALTASVIASTVKVEGEACNRIYEGSGFAVAPDLVVTNAHVVAGEPRGSTDVLLPSGQQLPATVVMFDPNRDLALLEVPSLGEKPLPLAAAHDGVSGAVFGHPNGQNPIAVSPARVVQEEEAIGRDLYDQHTTRREILVLAATLAHGDSGGALVAPDGDVIGVAFAISADQPDVAYALSTSELQGALAEPRTPTGASTEQCLND
jgi:S1-C subfamily serine protease